MAKFQIGDEVILNKELTDLTCGLLGKVIRYSSTIQEERSLFVNFLGVGERCLKESDLDLLARPINDTKKVIYVNNDTVKSPSHYTQGEIETIDFIKDKLTREEFKGYIKGNVIKYVTREALKGKSEDLQKAEWYLHFYNTGEK